MTNETRQAQTEEEDNLTQEEEARKARKAKKANTGNDDEDKEELMAAKKANTELIQEIKDLKAKVAKMEANRKADIDTPIAKDIAQAMLKTGKIEEANLQATVDDLVKTHSTETLTQLKDAYTLAANAAEKENDAPYVRYPSSTNTQASENQDDMTVLRAIRGRMGGY